MERCYSKVNENFGKIFKTLLPGTNAKVVPLNSKDISEGLEMHVQFGTVWKTNLSELSGG